MGNDTYDVPDVSVVSGEEEISMSPPVHTYVHVDDYEGPEKYTGVEHVHVFLYRHEDTRHKRGVAIDCVNELKENFVFANVVVFPVWVEEEMSLDSDVLNAIEWCIALGYYPSREDLPIIRERLDTE